MKHALLAFVIAVAASAAGAQTQPQPHLATLPITAGMHVIKAEVAVTDE